MRSRGIRSVALAAAFVAWAATGHAQIDVTGVWNFCFRTNGNTSNPTRRPIATLVQTGGHVTGNFNYSVPGFPLNCQIQYDIDSVTGAFDPETMVETCPFGVVFNARPAIASAGRIDGEYLDEFNRTPIFGLRSCDPMAPACDDGDPTTTDSCSQTVDCFGFTLPPSCVHTGCTTDADCPDAFPCTFDRCDLPTGCAHPTVLQPSDPRPFCDNGDPCVLYEQCDLTVCSTGIMTTTVADITKPKLTVGKLGLPAGNDTLVIKGQVVLPAPVNITPNTNGIRVRIIDANIAVVGDIRVLGGDFNPLTGVGWITRGSTIRYVDKRKVGQGPIRKVTIKSNLSVPGLVKFSIAGKAGTYLGTPALPLGAFVNLDVDSFTPGGNEDPFPLDGGACATFPDPPTCAFKSANTKISCR